MTKGILAQSIYRKGREGRRQTGFSHEFSRMDANEEPTLRKSAKDGAPSIVLRRNICANKGKDSNSLFHVAHPHLASCGNSPKGIP